MFLYSTIIIYFKNGINNTKTSIPPTERALIYPATFEKNREIGSQLSLTKTLSERDLFTAWE